MALSGAIINLTIQVMKYGDDVVITYMLLKTMRDAFLDLSKEVATECLEISKQKPTVMVAERRVRIILRGLCTEDANMRGSSKNLSL